MPQPECRPHTEIRRNRVNPIPSEAVTAPLLGHLLIVRWGRGWRLLVRFVAVPRLRQRFIRWAKRASEGTLGDR